MPGTVMLIGGDEFTDQSVVLHKALLRATGQNMPRVAVVPTAATDNPRKASRQAAGALNAIGAKAEVLMIANAEIASDPAASAAMETAHIIYLTDGNPMSAVQGLAGTEALSKLRRAWDSGVVLAASGASAMALCDFYWDSGQWETGLGVLKGIVAVPHYELLSGRFNSQRLRAGLAASYVLLGIDEQTGALITGQRGQALGVGVVTVCQADSEKEYSSGESFQLDSGLDN